MSLAGLMRTSPLIYPPSANLQELASVLAKII